MSPHAATLLANATDISAAVRSHSLPSNCGTRAQSVRMARARCSVYRHTGIDTHLEMAHPRDDVSLCHGALAAAHHLQ